MDHDDKPRTKLVKIGSLWTGKPGSKAIMSGMVNVSGNDARCLVFENTDKRSDKSPDYTICISVPEDDDTPTLEL